MIRNVIIHINNEQPLLADLFGPPTAADVGLVCTNLRTKDGRRPIFIDRSEATFFFPYLHIRFIELPDGASDLRALGDGLSEPVSVLAGPTRPDDDAEPAAEPDLEIDEDFLKRVRDI